jgi:hypothetical protein
VFEPSVRAIGIVTVFIQTSKGRFGARRLEDGINGRSPMQHRLRDWVDELVAHTLARVPPELGRGWRGRWRLHKVDFRIVRDIDSLRWDRE